MRICKTYIAVLTSQFDDISAVKTIYKKNDYNSWDPRWDASRDVPKSRAGSQEGSRLFLVGSHLGLTWDPRWDWRDPASHFYLGIKTMHSNSKLLLKRSKKTV